MRLRDVPLKYERGISKRHIYFDIRAQERRQHIPSAQKATAPPVTFWRRGEATAALEYKTASEDVGRALEDATPEPRRAITAGPSPVTPQRQVRGKVAKPAEPQAAPHPFAAESVVGPEKEEAPDNGKHEETDAEENKEAG
ncbi:hypothetical protein KEM55_001912, partial [Ascosphaera atra]